MTGIPAPGLGFFRDYIPGWDHQFHRDYRPGFADRTECYTRNFIDFLLQINSLFFKKNQKIMNSSVIEFMSSTIEIRVSRG